MRIQLAVIPLALLLAGSINLAPAGEPLTQATIGETLLPTDDGSFVKQASTTGRFEVEAGKLAVARGGTATVREFGRMVVADHSKAGEELKMLARLKGFAVPTRLDSRHQQLLNQLRGEKTAADFDEAFKQMMLASHRQAVTLFSNQARNAVDPELKTFASRTLSTLEQHGEMVQEL